MLNFFQSICCFSNREKPDKANRPIQKPAQAMSIQPVITENTQSQVLENDIIETDQYLQLDNQYYIEQLDFQSSSDIPSTQQPSDFMLQEEGINYQPMQEEIDQSAKKELTATRKKRVLKLWDATEDAQLRIQYEKHNGKWNEIAKHMPGRNVSQCCQRWRRLQPVKIIKRKQWTQVEDEKILELVQQHGKNWKLIALRKNQFNYSALDFPGILSKQIRERYINKIDPEINTGPWTEAEDATIIKLYQEYGGKWSLISSHLKGRPENMVKNRFYCYIVYALNGYLFIYLFIYLLPYLFIYFLTISEEFILVFKIHTRLFIMRILTVNKKILTMKWNLNEIFLTIITLHLISFNMGVCYFIKLFTFFNNFTLKLFLEQKNDFVNVFYYTLQPNAIFSKILQQLFIVSILFIQYRSFHIDIVYFNVFQNK